MTEQENSDQTESHSEEQAVEAPQSSDAQPQEGAPADAPQDSTAAENPELTAAKQELSETRDKYLRALAELENYKKRALKERSELLKYQGEPVLYDMVSIFDNLELALQNAESDPSKVKEGVRLIHKLFSDTLSKWDVRPESALGKDFEPRTHHALSKVAIDDAKPGTVIAEPKKAYFYKDKLLRAGEAVVATERPKEEPETPAAANEDG